MPLLEVYYTEDSLFNWKKKYLIEALFLLTFRFWNDERFIYSCFVEYVKLPYILGYVSYVGDINKDFLKGLNDIKFSFF